MKLFDVVGGLSEVFHTAEKGWIVRSFDFIPVWAPYVNDYTGMVKRTSEVYNDKKNNFICIDCLRT